LKGWFSMKKSENTTPDARKNSGAEAKKSKKTNKAPKEESSKEITERNKRNTSILKDPAASEIEKAAAYTELYTDNFGLIETIVNGFSIPDNICRNDIVYAGKIGLLDAIKKVPEKFNPKKGKFSTFSSSYIRKPIFVALRDLGHLIVIKEGSSTTKVLNMRKQLAEIHDCEPEQLDLNEIIDAVQACYPSITKKTIKAVVLLPTQKTEFGASDDDDRGYNNNYENHAACYDDFESESDNALRTKLLREGFNTVLTEREKLVFSALNGYTNDNNKHLLLSPETKTIKELAEQFGVSNEAIRQNNKRAFEKLSAYCRERYYQ